MEEIVSAAKEPFTMQKDIAFTYRVPQILVSRLVNEAEKNPEKMQQLRRKRELKQ